MMREIVIRKDLEELSRYAAELFVSAANAAVAEHGRFAVALAGGSTPKALYRLLASDEYKVRVDWSKSYFFFGDERLVPHDHPESNFRMAAEAILVPLGISDSQIFPWRTDHEPDDAANEYEQQLNSFFAEFPRFDLILLGLGTDAHTASLFPHSPALAESSKAATANWVKKLNAFRLTLTFAVINNAAHVAFLVSGHDKAEAVHQVIDSRLNPEEFPAEMVQPKNGDLIWLLDEPAAALLEQH